MAARAPRVDGRRSGVLLTLLLVLLGGALVHALSTQDSAGSAGRAPDPRRQPEAHASAARQAEVRQRFDRAVALLQARHFDQAASALHRVLELAPDMPEAHVNMGYALLGMGRAAAARDFFDGATEIAPRQANAYYGLAMAFESLGDLRLALSAMRSYLHLAGPGEDARHLARARAALWEWETQLGATAASAPAR
ncbi:MAG: tetratricopeptide repeat protein [Rubrivivax sp.]